MNGLKKLLIQGGKEIAVELNDNHVRVLLKYLEQIKTWNEKINITSIEDDKEIIKKHFLDSLAGLKFVGTTLPGKMIDIGTGGGLPGLAIKIVKPESDITFVDSSGKKIKVLESICTTLGINNYQTISANIEKLGRDTLYREKFNIVLSRAVAPLNVLLEYGLPLLRPNGKMIIYKGPSVDKEVENSTNALEVLGGEIKEKSYFYLPFSDYSRVILVVEKKGKTPSKYPRNIGIPRKRPL